MSARYTADGRRRSSMTHAQRGHTCSLCGERGHGNGFASSHGRAHVRRGEAVELVKWYEFAQSPSRRFLVPDDPRVVQYLSEGFERVEASR